MHCGIVFQILYMHGIQICAIKAASYFSRSNLRFYMKYMQYAIEIGSNLKKIVSQGSVATQL